MALHYDWDQLYVNYSCWKFLFLMSCLVLKFLLHQNKLPTVFSKYFTINKNVRDEQNKISTLIALNYHLAWNAVKTKLGLGLHGMLYFSASKVVCLLVCLNINYTTLLQQWCNLRNIILTVVINCSIFKHHMLNWGVDVFPLWVYMFDQ